MQTPISCRFLQSFFLIFVGSTFLFSQSQPPASDPQAVAFASRSISALTSGKAISDVTLTGNVTWSGGAVPETGTATLLASGTGESRMSLVLPSGTRTEIRDASTGVAQGQWTAESGKSGLFASQNCATDAVWFFPALGSLAAGPSVVLAYVGQETRNRAAVQHIQSFLYQTNPSGAGPSQQPLSTMDFYLDATTLLPVAVTFNAHPDNNASTTLSTEVDFSSYHVLNGVAVPTHIQRSLQGNVLVDITISGASFNAGLPLSDFAINCGC
jgi:hypothetical protein